MSICISINSRISTAVLVVSVLVLLVLLFYFVFCYDCNYVEASAELTCLDNKNNLQLYVL